MHQDAQQLNSRCAPGAQQLELTPDVHQDTQQLELTPDMYQVTQQLGLKMCNRTPSSWNSRCAPGHPAAPFRKESRNEVSISPSSLFLEIQVVIPGSTNCMSFWRWHYPQDGENWGSGNPEPDISQGASRCLLGCTGKLKHGSQNIWACIPKCHKDSPVILPEGLSSYSLTLALGQNPQP